MRWIGTKQKVRVGKNSGPVLSRFWIKVHEILRQSSRPFVYFQTPLPDCICHVSFSRYSPLSVEVVQKPNKCKSFWPRFFREGQPRTFPRHVVSAAPTVWQSVVEFRLLISLSEAGQWNRMLNLRSVDKNYGPIWSRLWTKVHVVPRRCSIPLVVCNALARLCILFHSVDIRR